VPSLRLIGDRENFLGLLSGIRVHGVVIGGMLALAFAAFHGRVRGVDPWCKRRTSPGPIA
jgi:hypothetical protein